MQPEGDRNWRSSERKRRNTSSRESNLDERTQNKEKALSKKLGLALLLAVAMSLSLVSVAFANGGDSDDRDEHGKHEQGEHFKAELNSLNRSGAEGQAVLEKEGKKTVETEIHTKDLAP